MVIYIISNFGRGLLHSMYNEFTEIVTLNGYVCTHNNSIQLYGLARNNLLTILLSL